MNEWTIMYRSSYSAWFEKCGEELQHEVLANLEVLKTMGPNLGRPRVDHIQGSPHQNMKELRVQLKGDPVRILFVFDPDRRAVLLLGGATTEDDRWYRRNVPLADQEFNLHLQEMHKNKKTRRRRNDDHPQRIYGLPTEKTSHGHPHARSRDSC